MAASVVSNVAARLGDFVIQEAKFLRGVDDQVKLLQMELVWMKSFLKEADSRQAENEMVRMWVAEIREIAYDAEDVIETFAFKIASQRRRGISHFIKRSACIVKEGWMRHKLRSDVEGIISRISYLTQRLQVYGIKQLSDGASSSSSSKRQHLTQSYPRSNQLNVVGLDNDIKELVKVLVDQGRHRVVSICGMGGLGKTTLAKKVYHHSQVRNHFKHFSWAYISQQCQTRTVWEGILSSLNPRDEKGGILPKLGDQDLAKTLYEFLKENKCLVVLDDIWKAKDWDAIKPAFPMEEETGSKILLTSRERDVALHADETGFLHEPQLLKNGDDWQLFKDICDSADYEMEEKMEELGKDMVKQCDGLPLAIVVLGGILVTKHSLNDWQIVRENLMSYFRKDRSQKKRKDGSWGVHDALALSYDNLPPYLKPCFLYLSVFPEDYEIPVGKLVQLWVAEDIVPLEESEEDGEEMMEDVAEGYLNELVERYMVLVGERDASSKIKTCRMHDLIRDFCLLKAKQENFICVLDRLQMEQADVSSLSPRIGKFRRLGINDLNLINRITNPHLRSALLFDQYFGIEFEERSRVAKWLKKIEDSKCSTIVKGTLLAFLIPFYLCEVRHKTGGLTRYICNNFKLLRILDFADVDMPFLCILLSDIGSLIHLRFLSMSCAFVAMLPSFISKLRCLQTLDLRDCIGFYVPNVLWKLKQLRHLYLPVYFRVRIKLKLDTLENLQTLVNFNTRSCYLENICYMKYLRELMITDPFIVKNFKEDLNLNSPVITSKHLRSLSISSSKSIDPRHLTYLLSSFLNIRELHLSVEMKKLPQNIPSNIAHIYLDYASLDEDPLPTLEKLPNLRILELGIFAFNGKVMICSPQGFPLLNSLSINFQFDLEELRMSEGAMPNLCHLRIANCENLKMLPNELRFITTLKELKIENMPKAFKDKLVEGGADSDKIQHVPSIIFQNCDD